MSYVLCLLMEAGCWDEGGYFELQIKVSHKFNHHFKRRHVLHAPEVEVTKIVVTKVSDFFQLTSHLPTAERGVDGISFYFSTFV
jgi:hypothetical protein